MVAPAYVRLEATAKRLIGLYGKPAQIVREQRSGPPHAPVVTSTAHDCVLVETGYSLTNRDGGVIQSGDRVGIISTDVEIVPTLQDRVRIDGVDYHLADLQPLNPGGLTLLYEFVARV